MTTMPKEPIQKRALEKKKLLLNAAIELFNKNGYHNTYIRDIATTANVSTGLFYKYFKDKNGIYIATIKEMCQDEIVGYKTLKENLLKNDDKKKVIKEYLLDSLDNNLSTKLIEEVNVIAKELPVLQEVLKEEHMTSNKIFEELLIAIAPTAKPQTLQISAIMLRRTISANIITLIGFENNNSKEEYIDELTNLIYKYIY